MKAQGLLSITRNLDKTMALLGIVFSIVLLIYLFQNIGRLLYMSVAIFTLISCLIWLLIRGKASLTKFEIAHRSIYLTLNILFFLFFICSILSIYFTPNPYERPLIYFIFTSAMVCIVALQILFSHLKKSYLAIILFQIIITSLSIIWSQLLIYPSIIGADPFYHQMFTQQILDTGIIPEGYAYSKLPLMHLTIGTTSLVTDLNYKLSTMFSISFFQVVCNTLFIFLLGKFLINKQVGLFAALLLGIANHHILMSFWTIPTTIAAVFILIIIYLLFKLKNNQSFIITSLAIFFMIALILTHTITAMCVAILIFISWLIFVVYKRVYPKRLKMPVTIAIVIFFTVFMLSWWTFASGHISDLAEMLKWGLIRDKMLTLSPTEVIKYAYDVPIFEQFFNILGEFIFFALSFIGCFYMISRRYGNVYTFTMAIIGITPLAIGFFSLIGGFWVVEDRWWYFSQILLVLPLSIAFFLIFGNIRMKNARPFLLGIFIFFLSFIMIISPAASSDCLLFSPNTKIRSGFTTSEIRSIETCATLWNTSMGTDKMYAKDMYWSGYKTSSICMGLYSKNFTAYNDKLLLIRNEILDKSFKLSNSCYKLDYDLEQLLANKKYSRIYNCNSVSCFSI